jgi:hypothetical protein
LAVGSALAILAALLLQDPPQEKKPPKDPTDPKQIVLDRSSFLRTAVKSYSAFVRADGAKLVLRPEGESQERSFEIDPDAEIRVQGYWGGLEDLAAGDRVWTWTRLDREGKPRAIIMIADEISEQDIHQVPYVLTSVDAAKREVVVKRKLDGKTEEARTLRTPPGLDLKPDATVYVRTTGPELLAVETLDGLAALKLKQKARLEERWRKEGLPGTIGAFHPLVGEVEIVLDHEAIRWGRALKPEDRVQIRLEKPVHGAVLEMRPWNERTRVTIAVTGRELADLRPGQRVRLGVAEPSAEARSSKLPPDLGRLKDPAARAEWFLASTYCTCSIAGDVCTGMFYTLAACNTMKCGMPNRVRGFVKPLLDKGLSDAQILAEMEQEFGATIWRPHLLK